MDFWLSSIVFVYCLVSIDQISSHLCPLISHTLVYHLHISSHDLSAPPIKYMWIQIRISRILSNCLRVIFMVSCSLHTVCVSSRFPVPYIMPVYLSSRFPFPLTYCLCISYQSCLSLTYRVSLIKVSFPTDILPVYLLPKLPVPNIPCISHQGFLSHWHTACVSLTIVACP